MILTEVISASPSHTDELVQASIDMIGSGIAILDGNGQVTVINKMWRDFGPDSGYIGGTARVGENYTDACVGSSAADSIEARRIVEDVRNVLAGSAEIAIVEYERESDTELRSFQSRVAHFRLSPASHSGDARRRHRDPPTAIRLI